MYAPDAAVAASAVIFSGGAEGPLRMASHRTMASRWNRHWRPTLIAGSSEHSAHKHTVLGDMPSQTANCAVLRREAGRSKGTSLCYSPVTPPAEHAEYRDPTTGTSAMEWPRGLGFMRIGQRMTDSLLNTRRLPKYQHYPWKADDIPKEILRRRRLIV